MQASHLWILNYGPPVRWGILGNTGELPQELQTTSLKSHWVKHSTGAAQSVRGNLPKKIKKRVLPILTWCRLVWTTWHTLELSLIEFVLYQTGFRKAFTLAKASKQFMPKKVKTHSSQGFPISRMSSYSVCYCFAKLYRSCHVPKNISTNSKIPNQDTNWTSISQFQQTVISPSWAPMAKPLWINSAWWLTIVSSGPVTHDS